MITLHVSGYLKEEDALDDMDEKNSKAIEGVRFEVRTIVVNP